MTQTPEKMNLSDELNKTGDRFDRFRLISWWDQNRLAAAKVLVVGAGALCAPHQSKGSTDHQGRSPGESRRPGARHPQQQRRRGCQPCRHRLERQGAVDGLAGVVDLGH